MGAESTGVETREQIAMLKCGQEALKSA